MGDGSKGDSEPKPWEVARKVVEHEDTLVNHRLTWLLSLHGFLFAAYALSATTLVSQKQDRGSFLWFVAAGVSVIGIVSPLFVRTALQAAFDNLNAVTKWWDDHFGSSLKIGGVAYPNLRGTATTWWSRRFRPGNLPDLLIAMWSVLLVCSFFYSKPGDSPGPGSKTTISQPDKSTVITVETGGKP